MSEFVTKDSGERVDYPSGMRRDVNDGKPRFDLMWPEGVPFDLQPLTRFAMLLARGASKYGDRNWERANSPQELARFKESAARHFAQWLTGEDDEDHMAASLFNLVAYEATLTKMLSQPPLPPESLHSDYFRVRDWPKAR